MVKKIIAGFGGAIALNIVHELIRKSFTNVPHINEVGEEALLKVTENSDIQITDKNTLYAFTLAGDVVSNGLYYSATATNHDFYSGLAAGVGAVFLPKQLGLNYSPVAGTEQKKVMTVAYYLFGAVVTKLIYDQIK